MQQETHLARLDQALKHLPHGPEFRFIDQLRALDPGKSGRAIYQVRGDEPFLAGHFPGQPLFPGVLLLEAGAQLAGVVAQVDPAVPPLKGLKLTAIRGVKIQGSAVPGEIIEVMAQMTGRMANLVQAEIEISSNGKRLMMGSVTLSGEGT